jgi:hypothetical protein
MERKEKDAGGGHFKGMSPPGEYDWRRGTAAAKDLLYTFASS